MTQQQGIAAPAATPDWKIEKMHELFKNVFEHKTYVRMFKNMGLPLSYMGPKEMQEYLESQSERNKFIIEKTGISLEE